MIVRKSYLKYINLIALQVKPQGNVETFKQRYFVCSTFWHKQNDGAPGPIFFYLGNEADVTL